ncbi:MAG: hypothetical protein VX438_08105 [Planctomycetota bacterium]|nr:hypothetical protein [Planctomycetota bacterium]
MPIFHLVFWILSSCLGCGNDEILLQVAASRIVNLDPQHYRGSAHPLHHAAIVLENNKPKDARLVM